MKKYSNRVSHLIFGATAILLLGIGEMKRSFGSETAPNANRPGQNAVDDFYRQHEDIFNSKSSYETFLNPAIGAIHSELDRLCSQKDCATSRLYWHRDLSSAIQEAATLQRPILALFLLGELTEELSCANSRLFRAVLYSDPKISNYLRDNYVLYWHSVRSVPKVTVDFGDGRQLKQTITGNSVHYLLDEKGRPLDALPGLYQPKEFYRYLREFHGSGLWSMKQFSPEMFKSYLRSQEETRKVQTPGDFADAFAHYSKAIRNNERSSLSGPSDLSRFAISKSRIEAPVLEAVSAVEDPNVRQAREVAIRELFRMLPEKIRNDEVISAESLQFINRQTPDLYDSAYDYLARDILADTLINDLLFRPVIQDWLRESKGDRNLTELNDKVYRHIFATPVDDRWAGLNPRLTYAGIIGGGVTTEEKDNANRESLNGLDPALRHLIAQLPVERLLFPKKLADR